MLYIDPYFELYRFTIYASAHCACPPPPSPSRVSDRPHFVTPGLHTAEAHLHRNHVIAESDPVTSALKRVAI